MDGSRNAGNSDGRAAGLRLSLAMTIFGTVGIFVHYIRMPSALIAMVRGYIGFVCLLVWLLVHHHTPDRAALKRNLPVLLLSGALIGANWIALFEAYRFTTVALATLCYYMQPVFLTLGASLFFRERLGARKLLAVFIALLGMVFVSGILGGNGGSAAGEGALGMKGILLGLCAAVLYAAVILLNKRVRGVDALEQTMLQLLAAAVVVTPYVVLTTEPGEVQLSAVSIVLLLILGVVHTGFAYLLYFGQVSAIPTQTVAVLGYLDPVVSILLSALLLREPFGLSGLLGAVLILGSALWSVLSSREER